MLLRSVRFLFLVILMGGILVGMIRLPFGNAQTKFPETICILETSYNEEILALHTYKAYAQKANSENYPNIARLFVALATSESIHARNFKAVLSELGVEVKEIPDLQLEVSSTKKNLDEATKVELQDIDTKYPQCIQKIEPENHEAAIRNITYAWESEKQHRDLLLKIQSGTRIWFRLLAKKIEKAPTQYFVCQGCGSTLIELPKDNCPICRGSPLTYQMQ